jgi:hypothetical protein
MYIDPIRERTGNMSLGNMEAQLRTDSTSRFCGGIIKSMFIKPVKY